MSVGLKWACVAGALVVTVWSAEHGLPMADTEASSRPVVVAELSRRKAARAARPRRLALMRPMGQSRCSLTGDAMW